MFYILQGFGWRDVLDIIIVSFIVYRIIILIKGTGALQVVIGLIIIFAVFLISVIFKFYATEYIFGNFISLIIIVIIVLFRNEIKKALIEVGKNPFSIAQSKLEKVGLIEEISKAVNELALKKIGAIIVFERDVILGDYLKIGIKLDSIISRELFLSIFTPPSPLHDGAVIIQKGRIAAASCYLPLSTSERINKRFGARHRAAIGLSELTDAFSIVISEETGTIRIMLPKRIIEIKSVEDLRNQLLKSLRYPYEQQGKPIFKSIYEILFGKGQEK